MDSYYFASSLKYIKLPSRSDVKMRAEIDIFSRLSSQFCILHFLLRSDYISTKSKFSRKDARAAQSVEEPFYLEALNLIDTDENNDEIG